jgi:hypothetical protein
MILASAVDYGVKVYTKGRIYGFPCSLLLRPIKDGD